MLPRGFASDNYAGAHPRVLRALTEANQGHAPAYGNDQWTRAAEAWFREALGPDARAFFVMNGTAANTLALASTTRSYNAVLCAATAHINVDECGAPERYTGM